MKRAHIPMVESNSHRAPILDYSHAVTERDRSWEQDTFQESGARTAYDKFRRNKSCPHCDRPARQVLRARDPAHVPVSEQPVDQMNVEIWGCLNCGWWCDIIARSQPCFRETRSISILRKFDATDPHVPLDSLAAALIRRPNILYDLHSRKFEELVASVVSDHFDTDVIHLGRTGDGGIDLVYLDRDIPVAIQVKRRETPDKVEGVKLVREFVGALLCEGFTRGKIITTAARFTKGSYETAGKALSRGLLDEFELVDVNVFYAMFRFIKPAIQFPWQRVIADLIDQWKNYPKAEIHVSKVDC